MILGLDFFRTITSNPRLFRRLAAALIAQGYPVYIITAVRADRVAVVKELVKKSRVPYTSLEIVVFKEFDEIPQLKLEVCKRLGIKLMLDDLASVCEHLAQKGILTAQIR